MITIGTRAVGSGSPCLVIAELGTSHQGDMDKARRLIDAAAGAGADCIKFQLVYADEILHPLSGVVDLPTGPVLLYEQFKALERDLAFYGRLKEYTERCGCLFWPPASYLTCWELFPRAGWTGSNSSSAWRWLFSLIRRPTCLMITPIPEAGRTRGTRVISVFSAALN